MKLFKNKKGFTLLELLIVLTIIGVLAGLMFPVMAAQVERSRAQEAVTSLGTLREAMTRYFQNQGNGTTYAGASMDSVAGGVNFIGFDPSAGQAGQNRLFDYTFSVAPAAAVYTIQALRRVGGVAVTGSADAGGVAADNFVTINQAGAVVRSGVYQ